MSAIRVLHVFGGLDAGGAESRTMDIYRQIDKNMIQFDFLIHSDKEGFFEKEVKQLGGRIFRIPRFGIKSLFKYQKEVRVFFENHPEYRIVHGHMLTTAFLYQKIAKEFNIPIRIAHSRSGPRAQKTLVNLIKGSTEKLCKNYVTHMFAVSEVAGYGVFGKRNVDNKLVKIIPNAVKAEKYSYDIDKRVRVRKELKVDNKLVVGHIGRFTNQKNHKFIVEVFEEINKLNSNSILILIGDGPLREDTERQVRKLRLNKVVKFLGIRSDVQDLLQAFDVLLFPSTHEGLPGVVLEAQSAGLPCVISDQITKEVKITDLVEYVSLDKDKHFWAEKVLSNIDGFQRKDVIHSIVEAGYDIKSVTKWYENFYVESLHDYTTNYDQGAVE